MTALPMSVERAWIRLVDGRYETCAKTAEGAVEYMRVMSRPEVEKIAGDGIDVQQYINSLLRQIEGQRRDINRLRPMAESWQSYEAAQERKAELLTSNERVHDLRCWPEFFENLLAGRKTFELRRDDRGFRVGDELLIREWHPATCQYSGREVRRTISHMLRNFLGLEEGYVILSFASETTGDALLKRARNLLIDAKNFLHPTTVWRDADLMEQNIERFLEDTRSPVKSNDNCEHGLPRRFCTAVHEGDPK